MKTIKVCIDNYFVYVCIKFERYITNMEPNTAIDTATDYRFNVLERLNRHTPVKRGNIISLVEKKSKKSRSTVKRIIYQTWLDDRDPNYYVLKAFAEVWRIPIEELENPQP